MYSHLRIVTTVKGMYSTLPTLVKPWGASLGTPLSDLLVSLRVRADSTTPLIWLLEHNMNTFLL